MIKAFILFVLIFCLPVSILASSKDIVLNKMQLEYIQKTDPEFLKKYNEVMEQVKNNEGEFAIFLLASSSLPVSYIQNYFRSIANTNPDIIAGNGIFFNGISEETYKYIQKSIEVSNKYNKKNYQNISFRFDPDYFLKYNIKKVPILVFSVCTNENFYPSDCETLFQINGVSNVEFFIKKIMESDDTYKELLSKVLGHQL